MTNTDSRVAVELDELAPWDDGDALENDNQQFRTSENRELPVYGFDSDKRTLVGLGPVERARRARNAAEIPDSERMPRSEPPGPFIADDLQELPGLRQRKLGPWSLALPAALVAAAAIAAVLAARTPPETQPAPRASDPPPKASHTEELAPVAAAPAPPRAEPEDNEPKAADAAEGAEPAPPEPISHKALDEAQRAPARLESAPSEPASPPVATTALPVTLPELPPPRIVDMSSGAGTSVGTLGVTSSPPANVLIDGRPLGKAPRVVQLPPGIHTVLFIHPLYGRQSLSVDVRAGKTTSASADF